MYPLPAQYYPWSFKNSYFLITSKDSIAVGGGGSFAIYLVSTIIILLYKQYSVIVLLLSIVYL